MEDILKTMKDNGFDSNLKLQTFYTIMTKIRKERRAVGAGKSEPAPGYAPPTEPIKFETKLEKPIESQPKQSDVSDKQSTINMDGMVKPMGGFKPQKS